MDCMWLWKCIMFIAAVDSVAACRKCRSVSLSYARAYSYDIKTFDCTDVRLGTLRAKQLHICSQEIKYLLLGNSQLKR